MTAIPSLNGFRALCEARMSVRAFMDKPLSPADLATLIEIGVSAPSVQNIQPWQFHVIHNKELRARIMSAACYGDFTTGTPTLVVVTCNTLSASNTQEIIWNPKELEYSCVGAIEHILLAAASAKLGGCWISFHHGPVHEALKLAPSDAVVGGMLLGFPDHTAPDPGEHRQRKSLDVVMRSHD